MPETVAHNWCNLCESSLYCSLVPWLYWRSPMMIYYILTSHQWSVNIQKSGDRPLVPYNFSSSSTPKRWFFAHVLPQ
ncbi:MAG: hypothetical protein HC799_05980 [Limnothrix sp. RL_2_0]|nr:hypothetical protein [Limnothrix sp. RL_2_0]